MDPIKIPQNVYLEDRIVGPITLRQIILVLIGGGISYMMFAGLKKSGGINLITGIIVWIPAMISVAFAFVRFNDLSLLQLCFLLIERRKKPNVRAWAPRTGISVTIRTKSEEKEKITKETVEKKHIEHLGSFLDTSYKQEMEEAIEEERFQEEMAMHQPEDRKPNADKTTPSNILRDIIPPSHG